jgi:uncharacterized damage-inducible protein DinB
MKKTALLFTVLWTVCSLVSLQRVSAQNNDKKTVSQVLDAGVSNIESEFISAAEAMPEDKYSFAPSNGEFKGVRTFAQQIKHVAAVNYIVGGLILGEKPPVDTGGENGPDSIKTKADILKFAKDSFAYAHKAVGTINDANFLEPISNGDGNNKTNRLSLGTLFRWHGFDHYGQMAVYLRMNGIVPPASRQQ